MSVHSSTYRGQASVGAGSLILSSALFISWDLVACASARIQCCRRALKAENKKINSPNGYATVLPCKTRGLGDRPGDQEEHRSGRQTPSARGCHIRPSEPAAPSRELDEPTSKLSCCDDSPYCCPVTWPPDKCRAQSQQLVMAHVSLVSWSATAARQRFGQGKLHSRFCWDQLRLPLSWARPRSAGPEISPCSRPA